MKKVLKIKNTEAYIQDCLHPDFNKSQSQGSCFLSLLWLPTEDKNFSSFPICPPSHNLLTLLSRAKDRNQIANHIIAKFNFHGTLLWNIIAFENLYVSSKLIFFLAKQEHSQCKLISVLKVLCSKTRPLTNLIRSITF